MTRINCIYRLYVFLFRYRCSFERHQYKILFQLNSCTYILGQRRIHFQDFALQSSTRLINIIIFTLQYWQHSSTARLYVAFYELKRKKELILSLSFIYSCVRKRYTYKYGRKWYVIRKVIILNTLRKFSLKNTIFRNKRALHFKFVQVANHRRVKRDGQRVRPWPSSGTGNARVRSCIGMSRRTYGVKSAPWLDRDLARRTQSRMESGERFVRSKTMYQLDRGPVD